MADQTQALNQDQGNDQTQNDQTQIEATIQTYFECMFEASAEKTYAAFHPNAKITGFTPDGLAELTVEQFAKMVSRPSPSPKDDGAEAYLEILSLDIAGDTAVARVRDVYLAARYLDTLSFLKSDNEWRIYNKLFHIEGPAGG